MHWALLEIWNERIKENVFSFSSYVGIIRVVHLSRNDPYVSTYAFKYWWKYLKRTALQKQMDIKKCFFDNFLKNILYFSVFLQTHFIGQVALGNIWLCVSIMIKLKSESRKLKTSFKTLVYRCFWIAIYFNKFLKICNLIFQIPDAEVLYS